MKILAKAYEAPEVDKFNGSKVANSSKTPGTGVVLTFSDANIWTILRDGIDGSKPMARSYSIDLNAATTAKVSNGHHLVDITILPLGDFTDSEVVARTRKDVE